MRVGRGRAVVLNHLHGQGPQELRQAYMKLLLESVAVGHQEVKLEGSSAVSERLAWNGASKSCAEVLSFTQGWRAVVVKRENWSAALRRQNIRHDHVLRVAQPVLP